MPIEIGKATLDVSEIDEILVRLERSVQAFKAEWDKKPGKVPSEVKPTGPSETK